MKLSVIPNSITLLNLFVGIIAVLLLIENSLDVSDVFILTLICIFLDYLDGFIARLLKVQSKFGSNLDSLADIISFGFVVFLGCHVQQTFLLKCQRTVFSVSTLNQQYM